MFECILYRWKTARLRGNLEVQKFSSRIGLLLLRNPSIHWQSIILKALKGSQELMIKISLGIIKAFWIFHLKSLYTNGTNEWWNSILGISTTQFNQLYFQQELQVMWSRVYFSVINILYTAQTIRYMRFVKQYKMCSAFRLWVRHIYFIDLLAFVINAIFFVHSCSKQEETIDFVDLTTFNPACYTTVIFPVQLVCGSTKQLRWLDFGGSFCWALLRIFSSSDSFNFLDFFLVLIHLLFIELWFGHSDCYTFIIL